MGRSPSPRRRYYKRKRSVSRERERHKQRRTSPGPSTAKASDIEFSFENYKRDLNKIILYSSDSNTVVNNLDDFWVFLKKYEATMRKAGKPILPDDTTPPTSFSKFNCINFTTTMKYVDTVHDDRGGRRLDPKLFEAFLNIVSIYIDFKNKEKFEKLRKLRQAQRDLPVAKFRHVPATPIKKICLLADA